MVNRLVSTRHGVAGPELSDTSRYGYIGCGEGSQLTGSKEKALSGGVDRALVMGGLYAG